MKSHCLIELSKAEKILKQQFQDELANLETQKLNLHCNSSK